MIIVPEEGMNVEALQTKYPIIDWEVYTEDSRMYWKIIRVGNHTEVYQIFEDMLKNFDRDDLVKLWSLVHERFNSTEPTEDKERELWVELKRLFEPDDDDTLWKLQRYMHDPLKWRLYDTCVVHHVSTERGHDIFMLVEKDYPLTRALMTLMLSNKLQVDEYSVMADELLRKIFILANRPRQSLSSSDANKNGGVLGLATSLPLVLLSLGYCCAAATSMRGFAFLAIFSARISLTSFCFSINISVVGFARTRTLVITYGPLKIHFFNSFMLGFVSTYLMKRDGHCSYLLVASIGQPATAESLEVPERTSVETFSNISPENKPQDEIYSIVDACKTAHDMWIAIKRLQQGKYLNTQDVKTILFWEFGRFTSRDGELIESYYSRFYKMMNEMVRNQLEVATMQVNVQFLQQLQPEWLRFYQKEVNEIRAEKIAKNANPLALVPAAQQYLNTYYQAPKPHRSYAPSAKTSPSNISHATTRHKGKEIAKPITPPS
ncbi:hypothetical protein Tco_0769131 [Tanacetum coccineum]|uniref:Uncharacterized protein n=1 Tax=Tanacetum coccineum TaxID=301880 RepID=A0ABQ4Z9J0_9ASTR